jgi:hypothetical protein
MYIVVYANLMENQQRKINDLTLSDVIQIVVLTFFDILKKKNELLQN